MGAGSSVVAFFRSLGGSIGVSALGAVLSAQVATSVAKGLAALGVSAAGGSDSAIPDMATLPAPVRTVFQAAFEDATGHVFLIAVPFAVIALVAVLFIREVPLRTTIDREDKAADATAPEPVRETVPSADDPSAAPPRRPAAAGSAARAAAACRGAVVRRPPRSPRSAAPAAPGIGRARWPARAQAASPAARRRPSRCR